MSKMFGSKTWINLKQVWRLVLLYLRNWKVPFKELELGGIKQFEDRMLDRLKKPLCLMAR